MFIQSCHVQKPEDRAQILRDLLVWEFAVWKTYAKLKKYTASLSHY